jgi:phosphoglycerol transferase MdoB-like AlkP superfamily enzyme
MSLFTIARVLFLTLLPVYFPQLSLEGWAWSLIYGLRLDLSASSYLLTLPLLLWIIATLAKKKAIFSIAHFINKIFLFLLFAIFIGNLVIYQAWGTMLNARAVRFIADPEGIIASASTTELIIIPLLLITGCYLLHRVYNRIFARYQLPETAKEILFPGFIIAAFLPLGMRGGFQEIPINESASYYSETMQLNHAATNPAWYLMNSINKSGFLEKHPYRYFPDEQLTEILKKNDCNTSTTDTLLTTNRPNIVLIVLESWSADLIHHLGGEKNITPFFDTLCDNGILFTRIYSSGRRTDQMFPSVISGFPSPPNHSLSRFSDKITKLPMLSKDFRNAGYHTRFFYGGELGFANMNSFLLAAGFETIIGEKEFSADQKNSKWGAHDEYLFEKVNSTLATTPTPFFSMILTLSTHEPFEVPGSELPASSDLPQKFKNAASYTDQCLQNFFIKARKTEWYKNTLFVLVADHGHPVPAGRMYHDPECYHIPLLLYGNVIKTENQGKTYPSTGGQHEIPNTLLQLTGLSDTAYTLGSTLFRKCDDHAIYLNYDDGLGWISNNQRMVYLFGEDKIVPTYSQLKQPVDSSYLYTGKAYLQQLYNRFLAL